ncbi:winged helix-turn-helix domain-containing protein [Halobacteriaceae bacterium SHR40]|uniref:helix-turn-helix transcriptional regulator n=1 Tax=Halovenus amylolytica TaxID=2500550 RepID=UPI000FE4222A
MNKGIKKVEFLASSQARLEILEVLHQEDMVAEHNLRDRVDCSRTTVIRNLDLMIEEGWIKKSKKGYLITTCGEIILEQFIDLTQAAETTSQLQPFLKWIPRDEITIEITELNDAELTVPEPGNPLAVVDRHVQQLKVAEDVRFALPFVGLHAYEVGHQRVLEGKMESELIVSSKVAEMLRSNQNYASLTKELLDLDQFEMYVYDGDIPFCIGILDDTVQLICDGDSMPQAMIETTSDTVRHWAEKKYSEFKKDTTKYSIKLLQ